MSRTRQHIRHRASALKKPKGKNRRQPTPRATTTRASRTHAARTTAAGHPTPKLTCQRQVRRGGVSHPNAAAIRPARRGLEPRPAPCVPGGDHAHKGGQAVHPARSPAVPGRREAPSRRRRTVSTRVGTTHTRPKPTPQPPGRPAKKAPKQKAQRTDPPPTGASTSIAPAPSSEPTRGTDDPSASSSL